MRRRMMASIGAKTWVNPYITDGLIAMWDGEWNAGRGVHDNNCIEWVNLADRNDIAPDYAINKQFENTRWTDNSFIWSNEKVYDNAFSHIPGYKGFTYDEVAGKTITCENVQRGIKFGRAGNWTCASMCPGAEILFDRSVNSIEFRYIGVRTSGVLSTVANHELNIVMSYSGRTTCGEQKGVFRINGGNPITTTTNLWANHYSTTRRDFFPHVRCDVGNGIEVFNLRIYNRALTDAEIAANYAIDKARFNLP